MRIMPSLERLVTASFHGLFLLKFSAPVSVFASLMVSGMHLMLRFLENGNNNSFHPLKSRKNVEHFFEGHAFPQTVRGSR